VASAIGRLDGPEATLALVTALADPDLRVRGAAAEALERAGYDDVALATRRPSTDELLAALRGQDVDLRVEAATRLGHHPRTDVAEALAGAVDDPDVGRVTVFALAELGDARAIAPLAEILFEEPLDVGEIDSYVASALAKIPDPEAVRALIPALDSERWEFEGTSDAIRSMGGIAVPPLVAALHEVDWEFQRTLASVLGSIGAASSVLNENGSLVAAVFVSDVALSDLPIALEAVAEAVVESHHRRRVHVVAARAENLVEVGQQIRIVRQR